MSQTLALVGVLQRVIVRNRSPWASPESAYMEVDLFLELDRAEGTPASSWFHALVACDYLTEVFVEERLAKARAVAARRARPGDRVEILGEWSVCYCSDGRGNVGTARLFLVDRLRVIRG
jgi:hypothetical protein